MNIDEDKFEKEMLKAMAREVNAKFRRQLPRIKKITKSLLRREISNNPHWSRLATSRINYAIGAIGMSGRLSSILDRIVDSVEIDFRPYKVRNLDFTGGIQVRAIKTDYTDLIELDDASQITDNGEELEWLRWLLLKGKQVIVSGYHVQYLQGKGRTGGALMLKGGSWSMPEQFAGRQGNNVLTESVDKMMPKLMIEIQKCLA